MEAFAEREAELIELIASLERKIRKAKEQQIVEFLSRRRVGLAVRRQEQTTTPTTMACPAVDERQAASRSKVQQWLGPSSSSSSSTQPLPSFRRVTPSINIDGQLTGGRDNTPGKDKARRQVDVISIGSTTPGSTTSAGAEVVGHQQRKALPIPPSRTFAPAQPSTRQPQPSQSQAFAFASSAAAFRPHQPATGGGPPQPPPVAGAWGTPTRPAASGPKLGVKQRAFEAVQREKEKLQHGQGATGGIPFLPSRVPPVASGSAGNKREEKDPFGARFDDLQLGSRRSSSPPLFLPHPSSSSSHKKTPEDAAALLISSLETRDLEEQVATIKPGDESVERLDCKLMSHQILGLRWLLERERDGNRGGLLADEMGLGKTVQILALILSNPPSRKRNVTTGLKPPKTTLIVATNALVPQWQGEIESKVVGGKPLSVYVYMGAGRETNPDKLARYDVVLTTYSTLRNEVGVAGGGKEKGQLELELDALSSEESEEESSEGEDIAGSSTLKKSKSKGKKVKAPVKKKAVASSSTGKKERPAGPLNSMLFYRVVLDEAHNIKNPSTAGHRAAVGVKAKYRWCLTGTPVQNSLADVGALFGFLGTRNVGPLADGGEFRARILGCMKVRASGQEGVEPEGIVRLRKELGKVMLRRTKGMTIHGKPLIVLPSKTVVLLRIEWADEKEKEFYEKLWEKMQDRYAKIMKKSAKEENGGGGGAAYMQILTLLLRLRQACNHWALITNIREELMEGVEEPRIRVPQDSEEDEEEDGDMDDLAAALGELDVKPTSTEQVKCLICELRAVKGQKAYCEECEVTDAGERSTKVREVLKVLRRIREGDCEVDDQVGRERDPKQRKTIIFSQFTSFFVFVERYLRRQGIKYVRYDGSMSSDAREEALRSIRSDPAVTVILISIKAGSVGLNLTCCSRVILCDLWWNPQIENQAFDRVHRFGQKEPVKIYKITVGETIEDKILELQQQKAELAEAALSKGGKASSRLTLRELQSLFKKVKKPAVVGEEAAGANGKGKAIAGAEAGAGVRQVGEDRSNVIEIA